MSRGQGRKYNFSHWDNFPHFQESFGLRPRFPGQGHWISPLPRDVLPMQCIHTNTFSTLPSKCISPRSFESWFMWTLTLIHFFLWNCFDFVRLWQFYISWGMHILNTINIFSGKSFAHQISLFMGFSSCTAHTCALLIKSFSFEGLNRGPSLVL